MVVLQDNKRSGWGWVDVTWTFLSVMVELRHWCLVFVKAAVFLFVLANPSTLIFIQSMTANIWAKSRNWSKVQSMLLAFFLVWRWWDIPPFWHSAVVFSYVPWQWAESLNLNGKKSLDLNLVYQGRLKVVGDFLTCYQSHFMVVVFGFLMHPNQI